MRTPSPIETVEDLIPWLEGRGAEELRGWLRESMAEIRRREQRALSDRELTYRRNRAQELLDQCGAVQDR